jgi:hypothetical protein
MPLAGIATPPGRSLHSGDFDNLFNRTVRRNQRRLLPESRDL